MNIELELQDMELVNDSFESFKHILHKVKDIENNFTKSFKLGLAENIINEDDIKLLFQYKATVEQINVEKNEVISKSSVEYMFFFNDNIGEVLGKIKKNDLSSEEKKDLIIYLDRISYPYIKEYIENKYKRANIEIKLPFEFRDNN